VSEKLTLNILSPERRLLEKVDVQSVKLPGSEGQIQILPGHAPTVGTLEAGAFSYVAQGQPEAVGFVSTGFFQVENDTVTVLGETMELQGEIDLKRAEFAQKKAESALQDPDLDEQKYRKYELKLQRALARQQIAGKKSEQ
jgi:F-type H+-transporting ATPase subunit epsilon